ncbi:MAG: SH3 domain-containing protein, partial [Chitinophagaceae bacterium]
TGKVKDDLWDIYNKLDPDFRSADLILNIDVSAMVPGARAKVVTTSSNLNVRKGPGTDQTIIAKAAHNEIVTLINKTNDQWWLIRTAKGVEGYAYSQYISVD